MIRLKDLSANAFWFDGMDICINAKKLVEFLPPSYLDMTDEDIPDYLCSKYDGSHFRGYIPISSVSKILADIWSTNTPAPQLQNLIGEFQAAADATAIDRETIESSVYFFTAGSPANKPSAMSGWSVIGYTTQDSGDNIAAYYPHTRAINPALLAQDGTGQYKTQLAVEEFIKDLTAEFAKAGIDLSSIYNHSKFRLWKLVGDGCRKKLFEQAKKIIDGVIASRQ